MKMVQYDRNKWSPSGSGMLASEPPSCTCDEEPQQQPDNVKVRREECSDALIFTVSGGDSLWQGGGRDGGRPEAQGAPDTEVALLP